MNHHLLDRVLPLVYAAVIVVCALWIKAALTPVAIVGALALGLYYSVVRTQIVRNEESSSKTVER